MKRWLAVSIIIILVVTPLVAIASAANATYEDLRDGKYKGKTVEIVAKPFSYGDYYVWALKTEKKDLYTSMKYCGDQWRISKDTVSELPTDEQIAFRHGELFQLTLKCSPKGYGEGYAEVIDYVLYHPDSIDPIIAIPIFIVFSVLLLAFFFKLSHKQEAIRAAMPKPVKTKFIDSTHIPAVSGGIGRVFVGAAIAGELGAFVGAATGGHKARDKTTFMVYYDDGTRKVETVDNSTKRYREYINLLDMGD